MKTETIEFKDFVKGQYGYKVRRKMDLIAYSGFFITSSSFFNFSPMVAKAYMAITGVGLFVLLFCILEQLAATNGQTELASSIISFLRFLLPVAYIAALIYFAMTNPIISYL